MKVEMSTREMQVAINALRLMRAQQQAAALMMGDLMNQGQMKDGIRLVTDLETKLVKSKAESERQ